MVKIRLTLDDGFSVEEEWLEELVEEGRFIDPYCGGYYEVEIIKVNIGLENENEL